MNRSFYQGRVLALALGLCHSSLFAQNLPAQPSGGWLSLDVGKSLHHLLTGGHSVDLGGLLVFSFAIGSGAGNGA